MKKNKKKRTGGIFSINKILLNYSFDDKPKYVTKEFQSYGYKLAVELEDKKRAGMYIKFAKTIDRSILERARNFVKDAKNVKSKSRLFMWKLGKLRMKNEE